MLDVPVLFVTFNRPKPTAKSFQRIRDARPKQLFLVSDGPRSDRHGEAGLVAETRRITEQVDWPCEVQHIYATENMGCGRRISSAITQAFESVDRLIVLEDDCVADPSFFEYCDSTLQRYENDERIMAISGNNFQQGISRTDASYYFSKYMHCWGWATWRSAWQHFSLTIDNWPQFRDSGGMDKCCDSDAEATYWTELFDRCHAGNSSSWAYPWLLCCWMRNALNIIPDVNLVTNIGFGDDATHTQKQREAECLPSMSLGTIQHPTDMQRNVVADRFTDAKLYSGANRVGWFKSLRRKLGIRRPRAA